MGERKKIEFHRSSERFAERGQVPLDSLVIDPALRCELRDELDPARVDYLAESIRAGQTAVLPILVKQLVNDYGEVSYGVLHKPGLVAALERLGEESCAAIILYNWEDFTVNNATAEDLLGLSELGTKIDRFETVFVERLLLEGKITDGDHEGKLEGQLGAEGQKVPVWVRARRDEDGEICYEVIDGYHRGSVLARLGFQFAQARVSYGMSDEELYDQRVIAANSVRAVQFARVIRWMQHSFNQSVWFCEHNLRLSQVLGLALFQDRSDQPGKKLGLSAEEAEAAIAWAQSKAVLWQGELGSIYQQIRAAEDSFDEIVGQVRLGTGGGHKGRGAFNPAKFVAMVEVIPGDLHLQKLILEIIKEHNINADEVRLVSRAVKLKRRIPHTIAALKSDPVAIAQEILSDFEEEGNGHKPKEVHHHRLSPPLEKPAQKYADVGINLSLSVPESRIESTGGNLDWLDAVPGLAEIEKRIMRALFVEGRLIEDVCTEFHIPHNRVWGLVASAQRKFSLAKDDMQFIQKLGSGSI